MSEVDWAGNYTYRAERFHRPSTLEQVQEIVANASRVRVLGSRHSFNDIAAFRNRWLEIRVLGGA